MRSLLKRTLFYPAVLIRRVYERHLARHNPRKLMSLNYRRATGLTFTLDPPATLDEKIAYLSLYTDTARWTELSDKLKVREYVTQCGLSGLLNELYGVYHKPEDIDFSRLPDSFVLKTNHACATNIFVADKRRCNVRAIRRQLRQWLNMDYGLSIGYAYLSRIEPCILAEKYLVEHDDPGKALTDYKLYCFHGSPRYIFVYVDRIMNTHVFTRVIYDAEWVPLPESLRGAWDRAVPIPRPASLDRMLQAARVLSRPFPFVRVDLYEIDGNPVFGEMTFTPGYNPSNSLEFQKHMGGLVNLGHLEARPEGGTRGCRADGLPGAQAGAWSGTIGFPQGGA